MTNNKTLAAITFGSLFVVFSLVVFVIQIPLTPTFWISYVFTSISFFLMILISYKVLSSPKPLMSKFLNLSLIQIAYSYFVTQLVVGVVLLTLTGLRYDQQIILVPIIGFVFSVALLGFTVSKLSFTKLGINEVERVESKVKEKVNFIREKELIIDQLIGEADDKDIKKALTSLLETIRFSDPMSNDSVTGIENDITDRINNLSLNIKKYTKEVVTEECNIIKLLLDQRNKKVQISK